MKSLPKQKLPRLALREFQYRWLRGSATPDPCEIDPKTQKAPLPGRLRWYRKNPWLRLPKGGVAALWPENAVTGFRIQTASYVLGTKGERPLDAASSIVYVLLPNR